MIELCEYEIAVFKEAAGQDPGQSLLWGSAMGEAIESLAHANFISRGPSGSYVCTQAGREYLAQKGRTL